MDNVVDADKEDNLVDTDDEEKDKLLDADGEDNLVDTDDEEKDKLLDADGEDNLVDTDDEEKDKLLDADGEDNLVDTDGEEKDKLLDADGEDNLVDTSEEEEEEEEEEEDDDLVDTDEEEVIPKGIVKIEVEMLWCSRLRQYVSSDNFSKRMRKEPDNSKRKSLRDAVPYTVSDDPGLKADEDIPEGEPVFVEEWHQSSNGGVYMTNNEACYNQFENTIYYDDKSSGKYRLNEAINGIIAREAAIARDAKKARLS